MRKAFSLMELMIVIIILGLLAAMVLPNLVGKSEQAKQKLVCIQLKTIGDALKTFKIDNGKYPSMDEGIMALVSNPAPDTYKDYPDGGYLDGKKEPTDPWKHPYIYIADDESGFDIISLGADGKEGGSKENKDISYSQCQE